MSRSGIVGRPIDAAALIAEVSSPQCGAVSLFLGTVRDQSGGRPVDGIDYTAYAAMAEAELATIVAEAAERFGVASLVVEHRVGSLTLGEVSVGIAAAHAHRQPALESVRYIIEEIKKRVPVWKLEHYT
ncbi:MAG: molybdenum cofactor biosynthesis protein MoaE, partial [Gemmatimonadota bacterium]|nr:molybdenum cofactor biosynthesis protein MoaE [Gemmatimonadota bacterium]